MADAQDIPAVVVGVNVNGLAVARALGRHGVPVIGVAADDASPAARSRYFRELWIHPGRDDSLVDLLLERGGDSGVRPVLLPVTDASVRIIASHQDRLRRAYRIGMPGTDVVMTLQDKRGFSGLLEQFSLPGPRTYFVDSADEISGVAGEVPYPCILKPQIKSDAYSRTGGSKAHMLEDAQSLLDTYARFSHAEPRVIVQEYVPGGDEQVYFCLQYYDEHSRPLVSFTGHKIRQWPPHCGGTASCEPVNAPELLRLSTEFFQNCGYRGLGSMEFKRDPRDGCFKMIEPTVCRTDWQSGVADVNGLPIAYVAYCDLAGAGLPRLVRVSDSVKWVYLLSERMSAAHYRAAGRLSLLGWLASLRPPVRGAIWAPDDPAPLAAMVAEKCRLKVRTLAERISGGKRK